MAIKVSLALRNALLQGSSVKEELDGGFLYFYAGPVPADADEALDVVNDHTQVVKLAADATPVDDGVTGLTFEATATNGALPKAAAEDWAGLVHFDGADAAQAGVSALTATFFRFCGPGDDGRAAGTTSTPRIQGSIANNGGDINMTSVSLSDNGTNEAALASFEVRMPGA